MKSTFTFWIVVMCINCFSINDSISQTSPEESLPGHFLTHIKQGNSFDYSGDEQNSSSFGCLDPSQPFTIELVFSGDSFTDNIRFVIQDEAGIDLYGTRLYSEDATVEGSTTTLIIEIESIERINCANYGPEVTLNFSTERTLWSDSHFHEHAFEVKIDLCCDKGWNLLQNMQSSYTTFIDQVELALIPDHQTESADQIYEVRVFDSMGRKYFSFDTDEIHHINLPQISHPGVYFLVIKAKNSAYKKCVKIHAIE